MAFFCLFWSQKTRLVSMAQEGTAELVFRGPREQKAVFSPCPYQCLCMRVRVVVSWCVVPHTAIYNGHGLHG